jgi:hypothetical protein
VGSRSPLFKLRAPFSAFQAWPGHYGRDMAWLAAFSIATAAQVALPPAPAPAWQPAAAYVTAGQDEPGYRNWYMASPAHRFAVASFNNYLVTYGVGGIVPTWQLLRTATSWQRCGAQPYEVPPVTEWPNVVQTLRYVRDYVIPAVGPVEPVSAYRNPNLNACAGGAPESAHKHYSAIDLVPLTPTSREQLMRTLCAVHARRGPAYGVGLGFYAFLRFHVDTTKFRRWGADPGVTACPPIIRSEDLATVYQAPPAVAAAAPTAPATTDPLAPKPVAPPTP